MEADVNSRKHCYCRWNEQFNSAMHAFYVIPSKHGYEFRGCSFWQMSTLLRSTWMAEIQSLLQPPQTFLFVSIVIAFRLFPKENLRKMSLLPSTWQYVCPSAHILQLQKSWTDFHELCYSEVLPTSAYVFLTACIHSDANNFSNAPCWTVHSCCRRTVWGVLLVSNINYCTAVKLL